MKRQGIKITEQVKKIERLSVKDLFQRVWALNPLCHWEKRPTDKDHYMRRQMKCLLTEIRNRI